MGKPPDDDERGSIEPIKPPAYKRVESTRHRLQREEAKRQRRARNRADRGRKKRAG